MRDVLRAKIFDLYQCVFIAKVSLWKTYQGRYDLAFMAVQFVVADSLKADKLVTNKALQRLFPRGRNAQLFTALTAPVFNHSIIAQFQHPARLLHFGFTTNTHKHTSPQHTPASFIGKPSAIQVRRRAHARPVYNPESRKRLHPQPGEPSRPCPSLHQTPVETTRHRLLVIWLPQTGSAVFCLAPRFAGFGASRTARSAAVPLRSSHHC